MYDPTNAIMYEPIEVEAYGITYEEQPIKIVDRRIK